MYGSMFGLLAAKPLTPHVSLSRYAVRHNGHARLQFLVLRDCLLEHETEIEAPEEEAVTGSFWSHDRLVLDVLRNGNPVAGM